MSAADCRRGKQPARHAHCSWCGARFGVDQPWPRTCACCGNISYLNPLPVAVIVVPVRAAGETDGGVVLIRRGLGPGKGYWALPGGFVDLGETWQEAGAREVFEEAGIVIDPAAIKDGRTRSAPDGALLVFGVAAPVAELPDFVPSDEASERMVVSQPPADMAFELHRQTLEWYFARLAAGRSF